MEKQMFRVVLEIEANPKYTDDYAFFDCDPDKPMGEAPEVLA